MAQTTSKANLVL